MSTDSLPVAIRINAETLRGIGSFADAIAVAMENNGTDIADVLGDGFAEITKDKLVGIRFIILDWIVSKSKDYADEQGEYRPFVTVRAVTERNEKVFFTDGSTGICAQLLDLDSKGEHHPLNVSRGLRVSEYQYVDDKGRASAAFTFYLNTSK